MNFWKSQKLHVSTLKINIINFIYLAQCFQTFFWFETTPLATKQFGSTHDYLLLVYSKGLRLDARDQLWLTSSLPDISYDYCYWSIRITINKITNSHDPDHCQPVLFGPNQEAILKKTNLVIRYIFRTFWANSFQ